MRRSQPAFRQRYPCHTPQRELWFMMTVTANGASGGVTIAHDDVTPLVVAEERQKLLANELNHRVKNTLAVVQAIATTTAKSTPEPKAFIGKFSSRLMALAQANNLLVQTAWRGAMLDDVIQAGVAFLKNQSSKTEAIRCSGPPLFLDAEAAQGLTLLLHELVTNAIKYGALQIPTGFVSLDWRFTSDLNGVHIEWAEHNGPPVVAPSHKGFGSKMIETMAKRLGGTSTVDYYPEGLRFTLQIPRIGEASSLDKTQ
jgi:two-component sensor histidine kinase